MVSSGCRRPLARRIHDEGGFSMIELMVVIGLLTLVLGFVMGGFVSFQNASYRAAARLQDLENGRVSMNVITRDLRTATQMTSTSSPFDVGASGQPTVPGPGTGNGTSPMYAGGNEVWFYGNISVPSAANPCPDVIHLYVDSVTKSLMEQSLSATSGSPGSCVYPSSSTSYVTRTVGNDVANGTSSCSSSGAIFTYYYLSSGSQVAFATSSTPLSTANAFNVDMVGVSLTVRRGTGVSAPCTTLTDTVRMPNLGYDTSLSSG